MVIFSNPYFCSNIGGTIFFDVEEYSPPYKINDIYEETDTYIIYGVKAIHNNSKRLVVKVILRFHSSMEEIADIYGSSKKVLYYEVHLKQIAESRHKKQSGQYGLVSFDMMRTIWLMEILFVVQHGRRIKLVVSYLKKYDFC